LTGSGEAASLVPPQVSPVAPAAPASPLPIRFAGLLLLAVLALAACGGGGGGAGSGDDGAGLPPLGAGESAYADSTTYGSAASSSLATANEGQAVTRHTLALNGSTLAYTAHAGHLSALQPGTNTPEASFFFVAYTLDGAGPATRPVTFFYNGGPGSASVWLHLGSFAPKRPATGDPSTAAATPFPFVDNAQSLLDVSDLVFVDAVGTGLSEAIAPNTNQTFWGVDADANVFRDFVIRWLAANGRDASPKFLFGESYGTTRSAVLVHALETAGVTIDGVVLQSSILDYSANCGVVSGSCSGYLPSYAATGAWYGLAQPGVDIPTYMQQMRDYDTQTYAPAVAAFLSMAHTPPSPTLYGQLQTFTGIASARWQSSFNLSPDTFQTSLVPGTLIGRYDARVSAPAGSQLASEGDPSSTFITPSFQSTINSYLRNTLRYSNGSTYVLLGNAINSWNFSHDGKQLPDTIPDLAAARLINPKLKLLSLNGYHDLATPFFQTENDLARLSGSFGADITIRDYMGGHMTYLDDDSRALEKADLAAFYQAVLAGR